MDPMTAFLFSMQAAGMVSSIFGKRSQQKYIQLGRTLEQEQYKTNLQAVRLQSAEGSLSEMKELRQNIGSQIAIQAARGNRGGSSYAGISKASNTFNQDEQKRRMNLLASESELRANHVLSGLHSLQSETQLGQALSSELLNSIQTTSLLKPGLFDTKKTGASKKINATETFSWGY